MFAKQTCWLAVPNDDPRVNGLQLVRIGAIRAVEGASPYRFVRGFCVCVKSTGVRI